MVLFDLVEAAGIEPAAYVRKPRRKLHFASPDAFRDACEMCPFQSPGISPFKRLNAFRELQLGAGGRRIGGLFPNRSRQCLRNIRSIPGLAKTLP